MKFRNFALVLTLASLSFVSAFAEKDSLSLARKISERAGRFLLQASESTKNDPEPGCRPQASAECIKYIAGSYSSTDDRIAAARACAGNFDVSCAKYVAGSYASTEERIGAAKACAGNFNEECAKYVAGSYASTEERLHGAQACRFSDVSCARSVAGSYASAEERMTAARACGGQDPLLKK